MTQEFQKELGFKPHAQWKLSSSPDSKLDSTTFAENAKTVTGPIGDACTDLGILNAVMKFFKNLAQVAIITTTSSDLKDSAKDISSTCGVFTDVIKAFSLGKGLKDIFENAAKENLEGSALHQRNLGIASGVFTTVIAGASIASRCDKFNLIDLGCISEALGTTSVLPFSVFVSGLEIVNNLITITKTSINIHETRKKAEQVSARQRAFRLDSQNIGAFLNTQTEAMATKQLQAKNKISNLHNDVNTTATEAKNAEEDLNTIVKAINDLELPEHGTFGRLAKRFFLTIDKIKAQSKLLEKKKAHDNKYQEYTNLINKFNNRIEKYGTWKSLEDDFKTNGLREDENDPLQKLISHKQHKWSIQTENASMQNIKDGLTLFICTLATVALIATIVLHFIPGVALISGVIITMTTVWLTISLLGLSNGALRKFHKPQAVPKTDFTKYKPALAI